ncbi:MAG TPA: lysozyme [Sphingobium sp.]|uniref:lysozyme n=1 Tax=Sphingobium sp. TaxID=1912891 RepID=UPI002ED4BBAE
MTVRRIGSKGRTLVKSFESLELTAYLCPADVWTIGYGSTGPLVKRGLTITASRADELLTEDLDRFERCVSTQAPTATQNQFDAMVSLAFNIGITNFTSSTLLRKHRAGDHIGARAEFARWNKARGKVLAGLTRRRAAEAALYAA